MVEIMMDFSHNYSVTTSISGYILTELWPDIVAFGLVICVCVCVWQIWLFVLIKNVWCVYLPVLVSGGLECLSPSALSWRGWDMRVLLTSSRQSKLSERRGQPWCRQRCVEHVRAVREAKTWVVILGDSVFNYMSDSLSGSGFLLISPTICAFVRVLFFACVWSSLI